MLVNKFILEVGVLPICSDESSMLNQIIHMSEKNALNQQNQNIHCSLKSN